MRPIIGLTGTICSGKGQVAKILVEHGFNRLAFGDEVREYVSQLGEPLTRERLQYHGNKVREEKGRYYWTKIIIGKIDGRKKYVVDGFRYNDQASYFGQLYDGNFHLVAVDAPIEKRFKWNLERKREGDPETIEEFLRVDELDRNGRFNGGQNTDACIQVAEYQIINDGLLEDLRRKTVEILERINCAH